VNLIHRMYCRSGRWRAQLSQLLPWATAGIPLRGATVLEFGKAVLGLTTDWLRPRVGALATVEYDDPTRRLYVDAFPTSTSITVTRRHCPSVTPPLTGWCVSRCCTMYRPVSCRIGCFRSPGGCCALAEYSLAVTAGGALCLRSLTLATHWIRRGHYRSTAIGLPFSGRDLRLTILIPPAQVVRPASVPWLHHQHPAALTNRPCRRCFSSCPRLCPAADPLY
jgi:hypothetical protein